MTVPAVIYARYSSHNQREESIDDQLRECRAFAEAQGLDVVGEYADSAISGTTADRPEFQRMLSDAASGRFSTVICYKLDRFARNRYDSAICKARLKKHGVSVVYAKENIPDGPEGIILESMLEGMAEYYSANLSQNIRRGMEGNALQCKANGVWLYGYGIDREQSYYVEDAEAAVVRRMFAEYADGRGLKQIADGLNADGLRSRCGNLWQAQAVRRIVGNEKYAGTYTFRDVRVENGMPAIVDRETFDACARRLGEHVRRSRHEGQRDYILTSRLYCGECGSPMVGVSGRSRGGKVHHYYRCQGSRKGLGCGRGSVRAEVVEGMVADETIALLSDPGSIRDIADACVAYQERAREDDSMVRGLRARLADVEKSIGNLIAAIERGLWTDGMKERMEALEAEKRELTAAIDDASVTVPIVSREEIVAWLEAFARGDVDDAIYRRRLVETFVSRVYAYAGRIVIVYNYGGGEPPDPGELPECSYGVASSPPREPYTNRLLFGTGWFGVEIVLGN